MIDRERAIKVASLIANHKPEFRTGPRKWKVRKLRGSRPAKIVLYAPFYLGELGRFPTFDEAVDAAAMVEHRAKNLKGLT